MEESRQPPGGSRKPDEPTERETQESPEPSERDAPRSEPSPSEDETEYVTEPVGPSGYTGPVHKPHIATGGSKVDAMGLDKYRHVVGKQYGLTKAQQAKRYGIFVASVIVLFIIAAIVAGQLDKPPESNADVAPWAAPDKPEQQAPVTVPEEPIERDAKPYGK
jgi:hypothetical protein